MGVKLWPIYNFFVNNVFVTKTLFNFVVNTLL